MKSSDLDHLKAKFKPTLFGLFQKQDAALLEKVYAYIYNKTVWGPPAITGCRGPVPGGYNHVTFSEIEGEFNAYSQEVQRIVLARVNDYLADFESAKLFPPTQVARERLLEVCNYFQDHIKKQSSDSIRQNYFVGY